MNSARNGGRLATQGWMLRTYLPLEECDYITTTSESTHIQHPASLVQFCLVLYPQFLQEYDLSYSTNWRENCIVAKRGTPKFIVRLLHIHHYNTYYLSKDPQSRYAVDLECCTSKYSSIKRPCESFDRTVRVKQLQGCLEP